MIKLPRSPYIKIIITLCVIGTTLTSVGCGTISRTLENLRTYNEQIPYILISEDKKTLAVIGDEHHYIFDAPKEIIETLELESSYRKYITASFSDFRISSNGSISGHIYFKFPYKYATDETLEALPHCYGNTSRSYYLCSTNLNGTRYNSSNLKLPSTVEKLNNTYEIEIIEPEGVIDALVTPIEITSEYIVTIAAIPFLAVGFGTVIIMQNLEH